MDKDDTDFTDEWDSTEDEGVLEGDETLDDNLVEDPLDVGIEANEKWSGANRFGTTPEEMRQGESLDMLLSEEEPDIALDGDEGSVEDTDEDELIRRGYDSEPRAGRLIAEDEGLGPDEEDEAVAFDAGVDSGAASAEEAAIHLVDDPDGQGDGPDV